MALSIFRKPQGEAEREFEQLWSEDIGPSPIDQEREARMRELYRQWGMEDVQSYQTGGGFVGRAPTWEEAQFIMTAPGGSTPGMAPELTPMEQLRQRTYMAARQAMARYETTQALSSMGRPSPHLPGYEPAQTGFSALTGSVTPPPPIPPPPITTAAPPPPTPGGDLSGRVVGYALSYGLTRSQASGILGNYPGASEQQQINMLRRAVFSKIGMPPEGFRGDVEWKGQGVSVTPLAWTSMSESGRVWARTTRDLPQGFEATRAMEQWAPGSVSRPNRATQFDLERTLQGGAWAGAPPGMIETGQEDPSKWWKRLPQAIFPYERVVSTDRPEVAAPWLSGPSAKVPERGQIFRTAVLFGGALPEGMALAEQSMGTVTDPYGYYKRIPLPAGFTPQGLAQPGTTWERGQSVELFKGAAPLDMGDWARATLKDLEFVPAGEEPGAKGYLHAQFQRELPFTRGVALSSAGFKHQLLGADLSRFLGETGFDIATAGGIKDTLSLAYAAYSGMPNEQYQQLAGREREQYWSQARKALMTDEGFGAFMQSRARMFTLPGQILSQENYAAFQQAGRIVGEPQQLGQRWKADVQFPGLDLNLFAQLTRAGTYEHRRPFVEEATLQRFREDDPAFYQQLMERSQGGQWRQQVERSYLASIGQASIGKFTPAGDIPWASVMADAMQRAQKISGATSAGTTPPEAFQAALLQRTPLGTGALQFEWKGKQLYFPHPHDIPAVPGGAQWEEMSSYRRAYANLIQAQAARGGGDESEEAYRVALGRAFGAAKDVVNAPEFMRRLRGVEPSTLYGGMGAASFANRPEEAFLPTRAAAIARGISPESEQYGRFQEWFEGGGQFAAKVWRDPQTLGAGLPNIVKWVGTHPQEELRGSEVPIYSAQTAQGLGGDLDKDDYKIAAVLGISPREAQRLRPEYRAQVLAMAEGHPAGQAVAQRQEISKFSSITSMMKRLLTPGASEPIEAGRQRMADLGVTGKEMGLGYNIQQQMKLAAVTPQAKAAAEELGAQMYMLGQDYKPWEESMRQLVRMRSSNLATGGTYDPMTGEPGRLPYAKGSMAGFMANVGILAGELPLKPEQQAALLLPAGASAELTGAVTGAMAAGKIPQAIGALEEAMSPQEFAEQTTLARMIMGQAASLSARKGQGPMSRLAQIGESLRAAAGVGSKYGDLTFMQRMKLARTRQQLAGEPSASGFLEMFTGRMPQEAVAMTPEQQDQLAVERAALGGEAPSPGRAPVGQVALGEVIPAGEEAAFMGFLQAKYQVSPQQIRQLQPAQLRAYREDYDVALGRAPRPQAVQLGGPPQGAPPITGGPGGGGGGGGGGGDGGGGGPGPAPTGGPGGGDPLQVSIKWPGVSRTDFNEALRGVTTWLNRWAEAVGPAVEGTRNMTKAEADVTKRLGGWMRTLEKARDYGFEGISPTGKEITEGLLATGAPQEPQLDLLRRGMEQVQDVYMRERIGTGEPPSMRERITGGLTGFGQGAVAGAIGGMFSGWELMRLRRMWSMTGAPVFQQYIPAAAQADMAGWQTSAQLFGAQPGAPMGGMAGGMLGFQAQERQSMIEAGRAGYQAYGAGLFPGMFDFGRQVQAIAGPAAGVGLQVGGVVGILGRAAGLAGPAAAGLGLATGLGVGAAALGYAGYQYVSNQMQPTAENELAELQLLRDMEGGGYRGITGGISLMYRRPGAVIGGMLGGGVGPVQDYTRRYLQERTAGMQQELQTPWGDIGMRNRSAILLDAANQLRGQGGVFGAYDQGQLAQMIGAVGPYIQGFSQMTPEQMLARPPELLRIAAQTGVTDMGPYQRMAEGLGMAPMAAGQIMQTMAPMPTERQMQIQYNLGRWAPVQAWGVSGQTLFEAATRPFQTEEERAAAQQRGTAVAAGLQQVPFMGGMMAGVVQRRTEQMVGQPLAAEELTTLSKARLERMAPTAQRMFEWGLAEAPEEYTNQWVQEQWGQFPATQARAGLIEQLVGMGAGTEAASRAAQAAGGFQGIQAVQRFLGGDQEIMNMIGMGNVSPGGMVQMPGGLQFDTNAMRDSIEGALREVIPDQYFDNMIGLMDSLRPLIEPETGLRMGTTRMWAGFGEDYVQGLPGEEMNLALRGVDPGTFDKYAALAEKQGLRGLGREEQQLRYGYQEFQWRQARERLALQDVSQFGGSFTSPYSGETLQTQGSFAIEKQLKELSRIMEDWQSDFQERSRELGYRHFMENWGVQAQRMPVQFQWQREDLAFQGNQQAMSFGWQMEDIDENLRFATGRQRRQLLRQQERAAIQFSMGMGRIETMGERVDTREQWAKEDLERQRRQYKERFALGTEEQNQHKRYIQERRRLEDELQRIREFNARFNIDAANENLNKQKELQALLTAIQEVQLAISQTMEDTSAKQAQIISTIAWLASQFEPAGRVTQAFKGFISEAEAGFAALGSAASSVTGGSRGGGVPYIPPVGQSRR